MRELQKSEMTVKRYPDGRVAVSAHEHGGYRNYSVVTAADLDDEHLKDVALERHRQPRAR